MKTLRAIGFLLILSVVALNIVYMLWAAKNSEVQEDFGLVLVSTFAAVVFWFTVSILVVYIKQSGLPYKSEQVMKDIRYIAIIFGLWTISFIVKIVLYRLGASPEQSEIMEAIYLILYSIVTDMVPYFSVMELKFIEIFTHTTFNKTKQRVTSESESNRESNMSPLISGI